MIRWLTRGFGVSSLAIVLLLQVESKGGMVLPLDVGNTSLWTASDSSLVSADGAGRLTILENPLGDEVLYYRSFTVPTAAQSLSFTLYSLVAEPESFLPAGFNAFLLNGDPTGSPDSLVPAIAGSTAFYIRDLIDTVDKGEGAAGVTFDPMNGIGLPLRVTVDISGLSGGTQAWVAFKILSGDEDIQTSVTIEDVSVRYGTGVIVPEPSTLGMGVVCAAMVAAGASWRRKRAARSC